MKEDGSYRRGYCQGYFQALEDMRLVAKKSPYFESELEAENLTSKLYQFWDSWLMIKWRCQASDGLISPPEFETLIDAVQEVCE